MARRRARIAEEIKNDKGDIRGFVCECGARHEFPAYVFAHWSHELLFKCDKCQAGYTIQNGCAITSGVKK